MGALTGGLYSVFTFLNMPPLCPMESKTNESAAAGRHEKSIENNGKSIHIHKYHDEIVITIRTNGLFTKEIQKHSIASSPPSYGY